MNRSKRFALAGVLAIATVVVLAVLFRESRQTETSDGAVSAAKPTDVAPTAAPSLRPSTSGSTTRSADAVPLPASLPAVPTEPPSDLKEKTKDPVFELWRSAILNKNAQQVYAAERSFLSDKPRFHDGLATMAEKEPNERVRAFSTRMLWQVATAGDVDLFLRLLDNDPSPVVRQNAARALGEIKQGAEALKKASEGDANPDVRAEAATALTRIR